MHLRHLTDEKIALWKWLAETCTQPGNQWEYQSLYEAALRSRQASQKPTGIPKKPGFFKRMWTKIKRGTL